MGTARRGYVETRRLTAPHIPPATPLPHQLTSFIGREAELRQLDVLLDQAPLVTLVGPGGVGKTRLALEVAAPERWTNT
jgi:Holliday junction resolvasome RuvABC ATP-dependent DNA helicase subunit